MAENNPTSRHVEAGEAESTNKGLRWRTLRGHYVNFHFDAQGIFAHPTSEGIAYAKELVSEGKSDETTCLIEDWLGNGWHVIPAEAIGALTGCTDIITQDFTLNDSGEWVPVSPNPHVFAHMDYAVETPIERWAHGHPVLFNRGEMENKSDG